MLLHSCPKLFPRLRQEDNEDCKDLPTADTPSTSHEFSPPSPYEELPRPCDAGPVMSPITTYNDYAFEEDPTKDQETANKYPQAMEATTSAATTPNTSQKTPL